MFFPNFCRLTELFSELFDLFVLISNNTEAEPTCYGCYNEEISQQNCEESEKLSILVATLLNSHSSSFFSVKFVVKEKCGHKSTYTNSSS